MSPALLSRGLQPPQKSLIQFFQQAFGRRCSKRARIAAGSSVNEGLLCSIVRSHGNPANPIRITRNFSWKEEESGKPVERYLSSRST